MLGIFLYATEFEIGNKQAILLKEPSNNGEERFSNGDHVFAKETGCPPPGQLTTRFKFMRLLDSDQHEP